MLKEENVSCGAINGRAIISDLTLVYTAFRYIGKTTFVLASLGQEIVTQLFERNIHRFRPA